MNENENRENERNTEQENRVNWTTPDNLEHGEVSDRESLNRKTLSRESSDRETSEREWRDASSQNSSRENAWTEEPQNTAPQFHHDDRRQSSYQNDWNQGGYNGYHSSVGRMEENEDRRSRKNHKGSFVRKAAGITAAALLFGTVSGGVMVGVNYAGSRLTGLYGAQANAQTETQPQLQQTAPQESAPVSAAPVSTVTDVSGIVEEAMPSIVAINDTMTIEQRNFFGMPQTYQAQSSGSGIIVGQNDTELLIATNNHVVAGATDLKVTFVDDNNVSAAVKGTDSASDLAIIAVQLSDIPADTMSKIKVATLGNSDEIKVGQQVVAIGNALGYGQSVTVGYVSALNREIEDEDGIRRSFIQTDAAINPGNSGGALLDLNGNVIGINAAKTASTEVEGMGFAIPISKAQDILQNLMTKKTRIAVDEASQGYLGIQGTNIDANTSRAYGMPVGIYVYKIVEGGAAASSDLKEKDIITKFDGQSVKNMEELKQMLTYYEGGSTVTLTVQSLVNGAYVEHEVDITLGTKPAEEVNPS